ncbi:MAG: hypothetical protein NTV55_12535 [Planctomycetota bacterium]|nr:hypothetical protein [Planctomycetota bacterium]
MGMFGIVCAANTITKDSTLQGGGGKGFLRTKGKDGGKPEQLTNSTFDSVVGSSVECIVGSQTYNVFGSEKKIITNPDELLRILYNNNEGGWGKLWGVITNKGGGETKYLLGNLKELTYRFTPNFAVDRFWNNKGLIGHQHDGHVHDIHFKPLKSEKKFILLPALFSCGLLTFDLVLVYKLHFENNADIGKTEGSTTLNKRIILVTSIMLAMGVWEFGCLLLMRILEKKFLYAVETLKKELGLLKDRIKAAEQEVELAETAYTDLAISTGLIPTTVEEQALATAEKLAKEAREKLANLKKALADGVDNVESAWGTVDIADHAYGGH